MQRNSAAGERTSLGSCHGFHSTVQNGHRGFSVKASIHWGAAVLGLSLACSAGGNAQDDAAGSLGGGSQSSSAAGAPRQSGAGLPESTLPIFDDTNAETAAPAPERCSKVDFLYVVDNSPTMVAEQANLARSFAGFSSVVEERLGTSDHHIMVVDTDDVDIGDILGSGVEGCQGKLGSGLITGSEGQNCGIEGNQRYLLNGQKGTADSFACLAQVGTYGSAEERPVEALLVATGAETSSLGSCNTGFLRDDAVLVVTVITDEDDVQSPGEPDDWRRALLSAKSGREESIVMLGLLADGNVRGGLPGGPCTQSDGVGSPRLQGFISSFKFGSLGSVCAPDYSEFFASAVTPIDTACSTFTPR